MPIRLIQPTNQDNKITAETRKKHAESCFFFFNLFGLLVCFLLSLGQPLTRLSTRPLKSYTKQMEAKRIVCYLKVSFAR